MSMSNDYFQFKQFTVFHDKCSMKVTTDGVLLGAWANVNTVRNTLDVGTGSGLIALMIAQRSDAVIDAVEIDHPAYLQACENAARSPWKDRIFIYHDSFQHFASLCRTRYDLIVSNPPYFRDALKPGDKRKSKARHHVDLTFEELLKGSSSLLTEQGKLCVIVPYTEHESFIELAHIYRLQCNRIMAVKTTPGAKSIRALVTFGLTPVVPVKKTELAIYQQNDQYSPDYINITKDFYLAF